MIVLNTPLDEEKIKRLKIGDKISLSGLIYTARDKAHQRMADLIREGKSLPFDPQDQVIYYAGPTPVRPGRVIGSIGPTTSKRMDVYTLLLLERGLKGMIGKGKRSQEVKSAIKKYGAVYFAATGGAAALLSQHVIKAEVFAFEDLGPEAIHKLEVKDFPVIVAIDSKGCDLHHSAVKRHQRRS